MIKKLIVASALVISLVMPSYAEKISLDDLNKIIEQTNFIVNDGCSGTLIDLKNKLVLTNYHCVDSKISTIDDELSTPDGFVKKVKRKKYDDVLVQQNRYSGYTRVSNVTYVAEIVAENQKVDLAVLKIKDNLPSTTFSQLIPDDNVVRGERVYIVGNPLLQEASLVEGIVSNVNRTFEFPWTQNEKLPMIQFSGGAIGGNSGGALYNERGQLIGVPAAGVPSATFIGLAIPHQVVKKFLRSNCLAEVFDTSFSNADCLKKVKEKSEKENNK